ncbi:MAG: hypothetical protein HXS48_26110 [Theionarchaea archaeon]|nr:MAG: hypothetical protein AYK19_16065 [Theionarchaea archaeon DG-70-1]MBU7030434.1 hypothetical protein [Theionarchaea archaeon]
MIKASGKSHPGTLVVESIVVGMGLANGVEHQEDIRFCTAVGCALQLSCADQKKEERWRSEEKICVKKKGLRQTNERFKKEKLREEITEHKQAGREMRWLPARESSHGSIIADTEIIIFRNKAGMTGSLMRELQYRLADIFKVPRGILCR